jgi:uncharacterized damage-inducible protein DinB
MVHPLVEQLRFTRSEWVRGLKDVTAAEAARRFEPINPIAWMVGHLAWQEQRYWLQRAQGITLVEAVMACGFGQPASNPQLAAMWDAWQTITQAADTYLDTLTTAMLTTHYVVNGQTVAESPGTLLYRTIYHYWYHLGEASAVRQLLGHQDLPWFVGDIGVEAPYRPE